MLFTLDELASHLQQTIDADAGQLAHDAAQGIIEGRAGIGQPVLSATITPRLPVVANDLRPRGYGNEYTYGGYVSLPLSPVTAVTVVQAADETLDTDSWTWDRFDKVYVTTSEPTVEVTLTAGFATVPADIKAVALALAGRIYSQPVAAVRSERVDDYEVGYDTSGGTAQDLSETEQRILRGYRSSVQTIGMW